MSVSKWRVWWITPKPWYMAASLPSVFDGRKEYHIGHPVVLIYRKQLVKRPSQSRSQTLLHVQEWGSGVLSDFSCHRGRGYYPNLELKSGFAELCKQSYFELVLSCSKLHSLVPRLLPDFLQLWREICRRPGTITMSQTGNGGLGFLLMAKSPVVGKVSRQTLLFDRLLYWSYIVWARCHHHETESTISSLWQL